MEINNLKMVTLENKVLKKDEELRNELADYFENVYVTVNQLFKSIINRYFSRFSRAITSIEELIISFLDKYIMGELQSEYDFLNFSKYRFIKTNVTRHEQIEFIALYNLIKTILKIRIGLKSIEGKTLTKVSDVSVIYCNDEEYNYQYISAKKKTILKILAK